MLRIPETDTPTIRCTAFQTGKDQPLTTIAREIRSIPNGGMDRACQTDRVRIVAMRFRGDWNKRADFPEQLREGLVKAPAPVGSVLAGLRRRNRAAQ
jgi:hypothetical protein